MILNNQLEDTQVDDFNITQTKALVLNEASQNHALITKLSDELDISDINTIITFGKDAVNEIAKLSDTVLKNTEMETINDTGQMLESLGKIMDKFDPKELEPIEKKNVFSKLFGGMEKQLSNILKKYNTMGEEVDKIYVELKKYENDIYNSNDKLEQLFDSNLDYYKLLTNYILAGEHGLTQIEEYKKELESKYEQSNDQMIKFNIQSLEQGKVALEQRLQDLRMAENVAMQSMPMLKAMQFSNVNLVRKINSAFIITLPVFKQSLAQAVLLKQQKIQTDALSALDKRTNEMLLKNAQNTVEQTKLIAELSSGPSIKIETLEETWKIITDGLDETKRIQNEAITKREEDKIKLENIKENFLRKAL